MHRFPAFLHRVRQLRRAVSVGLLLSATLACAAPAQDEPGRWAFRPKPDDFSPSALLDLRSLNEKTAGESGFVKVSPDGDFLLGNGQPVRFWAVNTFAGREHPFQPRPRGRHTAPDLARQARFLAKRGVNMVRLHAYLNPNLKAHPNAALTDFNADDRDWVWRTVAAMKKEGIYATISPYWAVPTKIGADWGVPGGAGQSALGLLFFDERLQEGYKAWLRALYAEKNPYTGIPLARDPAVAIIQLQNEDSLLFWTVNNIKGEQRQRLGQKFGNWLKHKYGSLDAAFAAWKDKGLKGDDRAAGILDFYNIYEMTQPRGGGEAKRLDDQLEFWSETMFQFNRTMAEFLRHDLGCKQLINAGNWKTADPVRLNDAERWSYTANEVMAVNHYMSGVHAGPNNGWAIVKGDEFTSPSALLDPLELPINLKQVRGFPMLVTESSWVMPNAYATEGPFLIAAYQSLTGVDTFYWFATSDDEWTPPQSANGFMPSQAKWVIGTPDTYGTFPAAALMFRQGYLKRGRPAVQEERALTDIWQRRIPIIAEQAGFDPNRDQGMIAPNSSVKQIVPQQAYLVGPVETHYGGDPAKSRVVDLKNYYDPATKVIRSITGEITLNYDKGFCTANAPKAQGVAAFFKNQQDFKLADVQINSANDYGTVLVVSLDDQPLKSSHKVLVQVGTRSRPTGWRESPATIKVKKRTVEGWRVDDYGRAPWQVERAKVEVRLANPGLSHAHVLDMNGNSVSEAPLAKAAGGVQFKFPETAMYVVLE